MSEESDISTAAETIRESVTETLNSDELESMLDSDATAESVGRDLGGRVGRELGRVVGRELGQVVATDVRERKDLGTILADVKRRFVELVGALLRNADVESWVSRLRTLGTTTLSGEAPEQLLDTIVPDVDGESETSEGDADEGGSDADDVDEGSVSEMSADDLQDMREETYRELLDVMSYRDLQSIAKEIGVKANLGKDEMTDRIIEEFSRDEE